MIVLGLISLLYGALTALTQNDAKRIVAYCSLSHLGLDPHRDLQLQSARARRRGGLHRRARALFSAALFLTLGYVEEREETRSLVALGGLGVRKSAPRRRAHASPRSRRSGLPGLAGFAGELLILTGVYRPGFCGPRSIALVPIVIAAAYMLRLFQGIMNGPERRRSARARAISTWTRRPGARAAGRCARAARREPARPVALVRARRLVADHFRSLPRRRPRNVR